MSKTVDDRVVSLEFDNKNFESNVKESMSTLDKLKEKLKFKGASDGIEEIEKASNKLDFSNMENGIDKLTDKLQYFTQKIVWNFADSVYEAGKGLVKTMTGIDNITTGWSKAESQLVSVQTILSAVSEKINEATGELYTTDDVYDTVEKLSWYADETSYSMDQMTNAIGNFTSTGIDLKVAEQMVMGISNACALAGVNSSKAEHAFLGLSKAIGAGSMTLGIWNNQMRTSGLTNSEKFKQDMIDAAVAIGTLKDAGDGLYYTLEGTAVSISDFTTGLNDAWMTSEVMSKAFTTYSSGMDEVYERYQKLQTEGYTTSQIIAEMREEFEASGQEVELWLKSFEKAQEAVTATQAFESTKEALGSVWSTIFGDIFGTIDRQKNTWTTLANDLYSMFVDPIWSIEDAVSTAFGSKWSQFGDSIEEYGLSLDDFESQFTSFLKDSGVDIDALTEKYGSLESVLSNGEVDTGFVSKFFDKLADGQVTIDATANKLEEFQNVFDKIWSGEFGNGAARIEKLTEAGYDYVEVQGLINKLAADGKTNGYKLTAEDIADLSDAQLEAIGYTEEQIKQFKELAKQAKKTGTPLNELIEQLNAPSGQELLANSIHNLCEGIINLKELVGNTWSKIFNLDTSSIIYKIVKKVNDLTTAFKDLTAITTRYTEEGEKMTDEQLKALGYTDKQISTFKTLSGILTSIVSVVRIVTNVIDQLVRGSLLILSTILSQLNIDIGDLSEGLGNSLEDFANWVVESDELYKILSNAADVIGDLIGKTKNWISQFVQLESVQSFIKGFKNGLSDVIQNVKSLDLSKIDISGVKEWSTENIFSNIQIDPSNLITSVGTSLGKIFKNLGDSAVTAKDKLVDFFKDISNPLDLTEEQITKIEDTITKFVQMLAGVGIGGGALTLMNKIAGSLQSILKPLMSFSDLMTSWSYVGSAVSNYINTLANNQGANNIIKIAAAVGLLATAMWIMAKIDIGSFFAAVAAVAALLVVAGVAAKSFSEIKGVKEGVASLSTTLLSLAGSLLILAIAVNMVKDMSWDQVGKSIVTIAGAAAIMVVACKSLSKNAAQATASAGQIIALAVAMLLIVNALKKLSKINAGALVKSLLAMIVVFGAMALVTQAMKTDMFHTSVNWLSILSLAFTIYSVAFALEKLTKIDTEAMLKALFTMITVMTVMTAIVSAMGGLKGTNGGLNMLALTASLYVLAETIDKFGRMDKDAIDNGSRVAISLLAAITALSVVAGFASKVAGGLKQAIGVSGMMIVACGSLYLMAGAILIFGNIDDKKLLKGALTVAGLLIALGGASALIGLAKFDYTAFKSITAMAVMLAVMAGSIVVLTLLDFDKMVAAVEGMVALLWSLSGSISVLAVMSNFADWKKLLVTLGSLIVVCASIVAVMVALDKWVSDPSSILAKAQAMSLILITLAGAMTPLMLISGITSFKGMMGTVASLALLLGEVTLVLIALDNAVANDPSTLMVKAQAISLIMGVLAGIAIPLSLIGATAGNIDGALAGMLKIEAGLAGFAALCAAIIWATSYVKLEDVQHASDVIVTVAICIGEAIGALIGAVVDGLLMGATTNLETVGTRLSNFMINIQDFLDGVNDIDSIKMEGVNNLVSMLVLLGSSEMKKSLKTLSLYGDGFWTSLGKSLNSFGTAMIDFSDTLVKGKFNASKVEAAASAGEMLSKLNDSLPKEGGLLDKIFGKTTSMDEFGKQLTAYAQSLVDAAIVLEGFDSSSMEQANAAGEMMRDLAKSMPATGSSLYTALFGEKNLETFGSQITMYAQGLVGASTTLEGFSSTSLEQAEKAGTMMSDLANAIPETGALHDCLFGGQNLQTFGNNIREFAKALVDMSSIIGGGALMDGTVSPGMAMVSSKKLESIKTTVGAFSDIAKELPDSGGLEDAFSGSTLTLSEFGFQMQSFAMQFETFANKIAETEIPSDEELRKIKKSITTLSEAYTEIGGEEGTNGIYSVGHALSDFGYAVMMFREYVSEYDNQAIYNIVAGINAINGLSDATALILATIQTNSSSILTELTTCITNIDTSVIDEINTLATDIITLIDETGETLKTDIDTMGTTLTDTMNRHEDAYNSAIFTINGLITGLTNEAKLAEVANAGRLVGTTFMNAYNSVLDINSPSKVMYKQAGFTIAGLVNGIYNRLGLVEDAGIEAGDAMLNSIVEAVNHVNDIMSEDTNPVITPVLDFSTVESQTNALNSLFGAAGLSVNSRMAYSALQNGALSGSTNNNNVTLNVNFSVSNAGKDLSEADINKYSKMIANRVNEELGALI